MYELREHFNVGSFLPLFITILGTYNIFLFVNSEFSKGFFVMIFSFLVYIGNNVFLYIEDKDTEFNEFLDDLGCFLAFGVTTFVYGFINFRGDILFLCVVLLYAINITLNMARNWLLPVKNSVGWPLPLNGIFFPFFYFLSKVYLYDYDYTIFLLLYIFIALLSVSRYNFIGAYNSGNL